jgi:hypothetical protein
MDRKRIHKWAALAVFGITGATATLLILRFVPMSAEAAVAIAAAVIVLKHIGLGVAVSSPIFAVLRVLRPRLRALCPVMRSSGD